MLWPSAIPFEVRTSPVVLDFNRVRTISTPLKTSYPLFSVHGFIELEDFGAGKNCGIL